MTGYTEGRPLPRPFLRWWVRARPCRNGIQMPDRVEVVDGVRIEYYDHQPGLEVYVPWWAWPLEIVHRLVFGGPRIAP